MAVSESFPTASDPAGMLMVALPLVRAVAAEVYVPLVSVTKPAGMDLPVPPLTLICTERACDGEMLDADGVTVTVGVVFAGEVTITVFAPVAVL